MGCIAAIVRPPASWLHEALARECGYSKHASHAPESLAKRSGIHCSDTAHISADAHREKFSSLSPNLQSIAKSPLRFGSRRFVSQNLRAWRSCSRFLLVLAIMSQITISYVTLHARWKPWFGIPPRRLQRYILAPVLGRLFGHAPVSYYPNLLHGAALEPEMPQTLCEIQAR